MKRLFSALVIALALGLSLDAKIIIENETLRLTLSEDGTAKSLKNKASGTELLDTEHPLPLCSILQNRPYDNENFLMYPAKPMSFPSNKISYKNDTLRVEFENTYDIAVISVNVQPRYISLKLERVDYRIESIGVKRQTEIDEFTLVQLPVKTRKHFGAWLNVVWDNKTTFSLMGANPQTRIDAYPIGESSLRMCAGADARVALTGVEAILVGDGKQEAFLDDVDTIETDYNMPRGVQSRRSDDYKYSYYECRNLTVQNVDRHIFYAKEGGFRQMVIYYTDFALSCGHFEGNLRYYPNGLDDLKYIVAKMKEAGMRVGLHIHYSKVSIDDPYVNSGTPDHRFASAGHYTLARPLAKGDDIIYVEENPWKARREEGRRLLMIGDEFITYTGVSTTAPYCFTGCERGVYNTVDADHNNSHRFFQPDVDDWPRFIRIDQSTSIQDEIAENIARIYDNANFDFMYFDGAEDVPDPYWYNVSLSQYKVWSGLHNPMLFAEGALKSHYGWHILSRGNAFDHFKESDVKEAMKKYNLKCAEMLSNDFTAVNFGWLYCDMSPKTYKYICNQAKKWNCPISYVAELDKMDRNRKIRQILSTIKSFEDQK